MLNVEDGAVEPGDDWLDDPEWEELWDLDDALFAEIIWDFISDMDEGGYL